MLSDFIDIICNNNINLIVSDGEHTQEEKIEAWQKMMSDYYAMLGDGNFRRFLSQTGRIDDKKAKIYCVISTVNLLLQLTDNKMYSPALIQDLCNWGYNIEFTGDEEKYIKDLDLIFTRLKSEERQLRKWIAEIEEETKDKGKITEDHFGDVIAAIAEVTKVVLEPTKTSVWSYIFLVKRLNKQAKKK